MQNMIASSFYPSLNDLSSEDAGRVKQAVLDFMFSPSHPSNQLHRIHRCKDLNLWSFRISADLRGIVYRKGEDTMLCFAGHHDVAYRWAENRQFVPNSVTGAMQIVEVEERVQEFVQAVEREAPLFAHHEPDYLLALGVPERWLQAVLLIGESGLADLIGRLPEEALERLMRLADGKPVPLPEVPSAADATDPFMHPDARRRFAVLTNDAALRRALAAPKDAWTVFLHPSQREAVERAYGGPAKVSGGAGTGKTVAALHRAALLARRDLDARVLLTTYSRTLAARLDQSLDLLLEPGTPERGRVKVENLHRLAKRMFDGRSAGRSFSPIDEDVVVERLQRGAAALGEAESVDFLRAEWFEVIDAHGIRDLGSYLKVRRGGRGVALGAQRRMALWRVFEPVLQGLEKEGLMSWDGLCHAVRRDIEADAVPPFTHGVADEVQDFGPAELQLLRALVASGPDDLLLAGDVGQRIYRARSSFRANGIEVVGRSTILRLNYRTTEQIRRFADRLLPATLRDGDGNDEDRSTVSLLSGLSPEVKSFIDVADEVTHVAGAIKGWLADGMQPRDIAVFGRHAALVRERAMPAVEFADAQAQPLSDDRPPVDNAVAVGTVHRAKGLEFRAVVVMGVEQGVFPLLNAKDLQSGAAELEHLRERVRNVLYVACTRAREHLLLTHTGPSSEFLRS